MRDPYEVLGVSPTDSDDEIKKSYRELVRKYHPDNYQGDPLQDMAEERMKEINDAYDQVQQIRSGKAPSGGAYGYAGYQQGGYQQQTSSNPLYNRVRSFIQADALDEAQRLLQTASTRDAEWHFLYGAVAYRKGWMDEAKQHFQIAVNADPNNMEYRQALQQMQFGGVRFHGFNGAQAGGGLGLCMTLMCARWFCYCC